MKTKKSVLFVRPSMSYGGADRVTLNLIKYADPEKYDISLALMKKQGEFIKDIPENVPVYDCNAGSLWTMWMGLRKIMREHKYDYIYATCGGASIPMMIAAKMVSFKGVSVVSERNILYHPGKNKYKRGLMNGLKTWLYKDATWITSVSEGVKDEIIEHLHQEPSKIRVVNNPVVDESLHTLSKEPVTNLVNGKKYILAAGRFEYQKDYDTMLRAFKEVLPHHPDVYLLILGKGPLEDKYKQMAKDMGIDANVIFGGFDKNPFKYMKNCEVFVLSSRHEGMPGVLVQAMGCGAAVVSTDCPTGPNEIITDGQDGFLVPVGDAQQLAASISTILGNDALKNQFRTNAPAAVRRFKVEDAIDSYFAFLDESPAKA